MFKPFIVIAGLMFFAACASQKEVQNRDAENSKAKADAAYQELDKEIEKDADK